MTKTEKKMLAQMRHTVHMKGQLQTLRDITARGLDVYGERICMVEKFRDRILQHTLPELQEKINALGTALVSMGLQGKHIAIVGENSFNWVLAFLAVSCGVGIAVPIDKELKDEEISALIAKGDAQAMFFTKTYQSMAKLHAQAEPEFEAFICMNGSADGEKCYSIDELIEKGRQLIAQGDRGYLDAPLQPDDTAAIVFTSGTTGANKGVLLSHRNFCTNVDGIIDTIPTEHSSFDLLPMNHVFELSCNIFTALYMNAVIYVNDSLKNILQNIQLFKPDAMNAVPLVLEGIYNGIWEAAAQKGMADALKKLVALSNKLRAKGIDLRPVLFATIRKNFGDKFPTLVCGGAPSRAEYVTGLGDFGFRVYNGYGLTESSPTVTLNLKADEDPTSAGFAFPKSKFIIHEPDENGIGEIWIKGDNVTKGYYKDEKANEESFEDGWFKTGDYGRVTEKGELFVSGRKKTLIILDNGKNIFPEDIEFHVMDHIPYIREAVAFETEKEILGRREKIIAVYVYVEPADFPSMSEQQITEKVRADVTQTNKSRPSYKKVQDVAVAFTEFEKTSTRKVVRKIVIDKYNAEKALMK